MFELFNRVFAAWSAAIDLAKFDSTNFSLLPQDMQPVAIMILLLLIALAYFICVALLRMTFSKVTSPFRPAPAPYLSPARPKNIDPHLWIEYFIAKRYFTHFRPKAIGWLTCRLIAWIGSAAALGDLALRGFSHVGVRLVDETTYLMICVVALLAALTHGFVHNLGRRQGLADARRRPQPKVTAILFKDFAKAVWFPAGLTVALFALESSKSYLAKLAVLGFQLVSNAGG